jgi:hypothetical protein
MSRRDDIYVGGYQGDTTCYDELHHALAERLAAEEPDVAKPIRRGPTPLWEIRTVPRLWIPGGSRSPGTHRGSSAESTSQLEAA